MFPISCCSFSSAQLLLVYIHRTQWGISNSRHGNYRMRASSLPPVCHSVFVFRIVVAPPASHCPWMGRRSSAWKQGEQQPSPPSPPPTRHNVKCLWNFWQVTRNFVPNVCRYIHGQQTRGSEEEQQQQPRVVTLKWMGRLLWNRNQSWQRKRGRRRGSIAPDSHNNNINNNNTVRHSLQRLRTDSGINNPWQGQ